MSTPTPLSASITNSGAPTIDKDFVESNVLENNPTRDLGIDGLMNLDQMGGIEMFFSQPIWPENVLLGQVGQSGSGEAEGV